MTTPVSIPLLSSCKHTTKLTKHPPLSLSIIIEYPAKAVFSHTDIKKACRERQGYTPDTTF